MDIRHLRERCQQLVPPLLARRGWRLIEDQPAFIEEVLLEVQQRLEKMPAQTSLDQIVENAAFKCYNCHWHMACQSGDPLRQQLAFIELHTYLYNIARYQIRADTYLAEECAQAALVKVWQKLTTLHDPGAFMGYAKMILRREIWAKTATAEKRRNKEVSLSPPDDEAGTDDTLPTPTSPPPEVTPSPQQEQDQQALVEAAIRRCLQRSLARQEVIIGQFLHEKTVKELADELQVAVQQIYLLISRAVAALRKCPDVLQLLLS